MGEQSREQVGSMLPTQEGAAFIYLTASQHCEVRSAGLEPVNSSVLPSPRLFRVPEEAPAIARSKVLALSRY